MGVATGQWWLALADDWSPTPPLSLTLFLTVLLRLHG